MYTFLKIIKYILQTNTTHSTATVLFLLLGVLEPVLCYVPVVYEITELASQHFILYLFPNFVEHLSNIRVLLSTHFKVFYPELCCQFLALIYTHLSLLTINLVCHQYLYYILCCVRFYLLEPVLHSIKGSSIIDSVYHNDPHSSLIVGLRDSFESLLASSIPYLQSDFFAINFYRFNFEIDSFMRRIVPMVVRWELMKLF